MNNKKYSTWILWTLGIVGAFVGVLASVVFGGCTLGRTDAPRHQYQFVVQPTPKFLTEELAIAKAREALAMDGYKVAEWEPTRLGQPPTKAPDGTPDKYFNRFLYRENIGRVYFVRITEGRRQYREYNVRLEDNCVICGVFYGL